jgi:hypothetical protein
LARLPESRVKKGDYQMNARCLALGAVALAALPVVSACTPSVSSMSCDDIATQAKTISQDQPVKINGITNVHQTSRTDTEARCEGDGAWSNGGNSTVYLKAYRDGSNTMVAYQNQPFG